MSLNYKVKKKDIKHDGEVIASVRGLSLNDILSLVEGNKESISLLFDKFQQVGVMDMNDTDLRVSTISALQEMPSLAAQIIAIGTDAYDSVDGDAVTETIVQIMNMPVGLQFDILEGIGRLTFASQGAVKKTLGAIRPLLTGLGESGAMDSMIGSGA